MPLLRLGVGREASEVLPNCIVSGRSKEKKGSACDLVSLLFCRFCFMFLYAYPISICDISICARIYVIIFKGTCDIRFSYLCI